MSVCDVVIPCRDEAAALPIALADVPPGWRVIVVDNGSTDGTADVARSLGAYVVTEPRPGYGAAVHAGMLAAEAEYVAVMDGDASMRLARPRADAGPRTFRGGDDGRRPTPSHRPRGVALARASGHAAAGDLDPPPLGVPDPRPRADACLPPRPTCWPWACEDRRFGYPLELMLRAAEAGWTVQEIDVDYDRRAAGTKSKVSGSVRGTARVVQDFAKVLR